MKKKYILILVFLILFIGVYYYNEFNKPFIGVLFSDSTSKDSEIKILNKNLNIKKDIKINAIDAPMVSYTNNSIYIPTSLDDKLFYMDNNFKLSEKTVLPGTTYMKTKQDDQLILFNPPKNKKYGDVNKVSFKHQTKEDILDINNSLLLCGDFNNNFIYVIGTKFDTDGSTQSYLFIIDRLNFKLTDQIKIPDNIRVSTCEIIDNKLFISPDRKVNYFLYYDFVDKEMKTIKYNELIKNNLDISTIIYNDNYIFEISLTGDVVKLERKNLDIIDSTMLDKKVIISGDIKDNKLYLLSQDEIKTQMSTIDVLDANNLKKVNEIKLQPTRNTMARYIYIYK